MDFINFISPKITIIFHRVPRLIMKPILRSPKTPRKGLYTYFPAQIDYAIMLVFGGIPWQAYFQRVLSARNVSVAKTLSFIAAFGCFSAAIPSIVIGKC